MYTAVTQVIIVIAQDEHLKHRLVSFFDAAIASRYPVMAYSCVDEFINSGYDQTAAAIILSTDTKDQKQFLDYRQARLDLIPVIFIADEATACSDGPDWTKVPLCEVFDKGQIRADLVLTALKYIVEVNAVISEMSNLQRAVELADQTNNRFFQYMSHELAGPLQAARTLQENTSVLADIEEIKSNSRITALAITHVLDAINNISEYVRVSRNQLSMRRETFSVIPVVEDLVQLFGDHAAHKGIVLKSEYTNDTDCVYLGDKLRMRQVLVNLIKNAIKFTDQGAVLISLQRVQNNLCISVTDTGIGMAPELVSEIMSRNSYTPGADFDGGLGIGLKLSREFLAMAGGHLEVTSEQGKGSVFTAILPNECYQYHKSEVLSAAS